MSLLRAESKLNREVLLRLLEKGRLKQGEVVVLNPILEKAVGNLNCHGIVLKRNGFDWSYPGLEALRVQFVFDGLQNVLPEFIHMNHARGIKGSRNSDREGRNKTTALSFLMNASSVFSLSAELSTVVGT